MDESKNLSDEELYVDHRVVHEWHERGGSHGWSKEELVDYHAALVGAMLELGMKHEEVDDLDKGIKEIVQNKEWQRLRKNLIGTWMDNQEANVAILRKFLGTVGQASDDKLRIVLNYLTGSGFKSKTISHPAITLFLEEVRQEGERRKGILPPVEEEVEDAQA